MAPSPPSDVLIGPGLPTPDICLENGRYALYQADCLDLMPRLPHGSVDMIFADPPYFLSNGGITCKAGKRVSVNKGEWDRSLGFQGNYDFTRKWIAECQRVLKPDGSIWISGTSHIIHIVGCCLEDLGFKLLNDITWVKVNPPPNLSCRYFTHATETVIWAARDKKSRHRFNYDLMRQLNGGKQMLSVWTIGAPRSAEKIFGKHPTQKPVALLERLIAASTLENDLILDPFSGSCTTGIAAARLNRRYIGVELDPEFTELAARRLKAELRQESRSPLLQAATQSHAQRQTDHRKAGETWREIMTVGSKSLQSCESSRLSTRKNISI